MNSFIKSLMVFLVGGAGGALLTYALLEKRYEEYEDELQSELKAEYDDEYREYLDAVLETSDTKYQDPKTEMEGGDYDKAMDDTKPIIKKYTQYHKMSQSELAKEVEPGRAPYIIKEDEYSNELSTSIMRHKKELLYYYAEDDALTDEREEIITNGYDIIGDEALSNFGESGDDPDVVYVRNENLSTDYEIIRLNKSYQATVLGFVDEVPGRKKVKNNGRENSSGE